MNKYIGVILLSLLLAGCVQVHVHEAGNNKPDVLRIDADGNMSLNGRSVSEEDIVIYPDGSGGERAAIKMRVPVRSDYYRDTIVVEREVPVVYEDAATSAAGETE